jgi:(R)-2-hydroxyacyl-CoA dehydratese activating ATPase
MTLTIGIDIGSGTSKGVIIQNGRIIASRISPSGVNYRMLAQKLRDELLAEAGLEAEDVVCIATTGHGAGIIPFSNLQVSDIQCCARGINFIFPSARTVIDIQEQSSQVIKLNENGMVIDFAANETCISGSGYFLKIIANVMQIDLKEIGPLSLQSQNPVILTTGCAVFGESEVISRISEGIPKEDILAGVHQAFVERIFSLINKIRIEEPCAISGGGALNAGLTKRFEKLGLRLLVPPQPQLVNALGAALIAEKRTN